MDAHDCIVSRSRESGTVVACTCGLALGPYMDHVRALAEARAHRAASAQRRATAAAQRPPSTDERATP